MGAVVDAAKDIGRDAIEAPEKAIAKAAGAYFGLMTGGVIGGVAGKNTATNLTEGKSVVRSTVSGGAKALQDFNIVDKPEEIKPIQADDPAAVAAAAEKEKARKARQFQIDTMTGQPGRGGTILTDNYQYKV